MIAQYAWLDKPGPEQSMNLTIDDNRWQSMSINRLIMVIDGQSIVQVFVIIDCHQFSVTLINRKEAINCITSIFIDYQY